MKVETVKCDVCGRVKGEANKWVQIIFVTHQPTFMTVAGSLDRSAVGHQDVCSDVCLQKRLSEMLTIIREQPHESPAHEMKQLAIANGSGRFECSCGWKGVVINDADMFNGPTMEQRVLHAQAEARKHLEQAMPDTDGRSWNQNFGFLGRAK